MPEQTWSHLQKQNQSRGTLWSKEKGLPWSCLIVKPKGYKSWPSTIMSPWTRASGHCCGSRAASCELVVIPFGTACTTHTWHGWLYRTAVKLSLPLLLQTAINCGSWTWPTVTLKAPVEYKATRRPDGEMQAFYVTGRYGLPLGLVGPRQPTRLGQPEGRREVLSQTKHTFQ